MTQATEIIQCTQEQKDEWSDLHDRANQAFDDADAAARVVASYLLKHVAAGGMAPSDYGLPSEDAVQAYRYACEYAEKAGQDLAEWERLRAEIDAHPYTTEFAANREAARQAAS